jgi:NADH-quinone oxidoreductase subunit J
MTLESLLFYVLSAGVVLAAIGVVTARSAVYSVLSLVLTMCLIAGLFVLLKAMFVATVLVLVYAGAILVLFIFVVMMVDVKDPPRDWKLMSAPPLFAGILAVLLFTQIFKVIQKTDLPGATVIHGTAQNLGRLIFGEYALPFELTSFLLLAAVVSVVVLAKKDAE